MSKFQIILLSVFGVFIVAGVLIFSFTQKSGSGSASVVIWGGISSYDFNTVIGNTNLNQDKTLQISYVEKSPDTIEREFTEALATDTGPDLIILPLEKLWANRNKLYPMPYKGVSERDFKELFIEAGELYMTPEGVYALPLSVDPLVLYYNRDLLSKEAIAQPLAYWDEIYTTTLKLTDKDPAGNITQSTMALGEARNIPNYKSILSLFLLQAGTPITQLSGGELRPVISGSFNQTTSPGSAALDFYTQFSNPAKTYYSWNRSLLPADTHFTSGLSAYYLGFASEFRTLRNKNPTLNLGVASVPQSRVSGKAITFAHVEGVSISRGTRDASAALGAAYKLVRPDVIQAISRQLVLPPTRRDLLVERPSDAILSVFYDSALQSRAWIDPESTASTLIFREMIESVTSGRARTSEALSKANSELDNLAN